MTVLRTAVRIPPVEAAAAKNAPFAALSLRHKGGGRSARRAQLYGLRRCAACRSRTGDLRGAVRCSREYAPVRRYAAALAASRGERPFCARRSGRKRSNRSAPIAGKGRQRPAKTGLELSGSPLHGLILCQFSRRSGKGAQRVSRLSPPFLCAVFTAGTASDSFRSS